MNSTLHRRFFRGFLAMGFGQVITLVTQILGVPLFLHFWGINKMGEWLLLSTIPSYLSISDLSFGTIAGNEMTMLVSAGRKDRVQEVYHSTFAFILCTCTLGFVLTGLFAFLVPIKGIFGLHLIDHHDANWAFMGLVLQVTLSQIGAIYLAAYRAGGHFALGTVAGNLLRLVEFIASVVVLMMGGGVVEVAASYVATRFVGYVAMDIHARKLVPWLKLGVRDAKWSSVKVIMGPALTYNAFPLGQAMNLQGVVFVVGKLFGPGAVAAFSFARTMSRVVYQFATTISNVTWDELSRAFGAGNLELAARIHRRACQVGFWGALVGAILFGVFGPWLYFLWTHHLTLDRTLFHLLLVVSVISSMWSISYVVPLSSNRHQKLALIYAIVMTASVGLAWACGKFFGMPGVGVALISVEVVMSLIVFRMSLKMAHDNWSTFFGLVFTPPFRWLLNRYRQWRENDPVPQDLIDTVEEGEFDGGPEHPGQPTTAMPGIILAERTIAERAIVAELNETRTPAQAAKALSSVVVGTFGRFHSFDLARQLENRHMLTGVFTGYPWLKVRDEGLPHSKVHCFPVYQVIAIGQGRLSHPFGGLRKALDWITVQTLDAFIAKRMPKCDAYICLSGAGLRSGQKARERGAIYVCDRGSAHIRVQDEIMRAEFEKVGIPYIEVDPRVIEKEEKEYELADLILTPSTFACQTFIDQGIPAEKLLLAPYGVDLGRFSSDGEPDPEYFDVLFVGVSSIRKGIPYLVEAFGRLQHPRKRLTILGPIQSESRPFLREADRHGDVRILGAQPKPKVREYMSRSHVLVLPSVEDGFGLVMAEAMACGCPVIASNHTGGPDLFTNGVEGFVFQSQDATALLEALQKLASNEALRKKMARAARKRVEQLGGWNAYADIIVGKLSAMLRERG